MRRRKGSMLPFPHALSPSLDPALRANARSKWMECAGEGASSMAAGRAAAAEAAAAADVAARRLSPACSSSRAPTVARVLAFPGAPCTAPAGPPSDRSTAWWCDPCTCAAAPCPTTWSHRSSPRKLTTSPRPHPTSATPASLSPRQPSGRLLFALQLVLVNRSTALY